MHVPRWFSTSYIADLHIFAHFSFDTRQHCHLSLIYFVVIPESIDYELTGSRSIRIGEFRSRADTPSDPNEA
jgi:hypothetical protein